MKEAGEFAVDVVYEARKNDKATKLDMVQPRDIEADKGQNRQCEKKKG